jgi:probable rRNA maturation factor
MTATADHSSFGFELCIEDDAWAAALPDLEALSDRIAKQISTLIETPALTAAILLTSNDEVADLNSQWRGKPGPTNVLSFPAPEGAGTLGDIALAYGVIADEARAQGKAFADHTAHLMVHGALHLLGYDHEVDDEATEMEGLEIECLAALGIANPYGDP